MFRLRFDVEHMSWFRKLFTRRKVKPVPAAFETAWHPAGKAFIRMTLEASSLRQGFGRQAGRGR